MHIQSSKTCYPMAGHCATEAISSRCAWTLTTARTQHWTLQTNEHCAFFRLKLINIGVYVLCLRCVDFFIFQLLQCLSVDFICTSFVQSALFDLMVVEKHTEEKKNVQKCNRTEPKF